MKTTGEYKKKWQKIESDFAGLKLALDKWEVVRERGEHVRYHIIFRYKAVG